MRIGFCAQHCVKHTTYVNYLILSSQEFPQNGYYYLHLMHEKNEAEAETCPRAWATRWQSLDWSPGLDLQVEQLVFSQNTPELGQYYMPVWVGYDHDLSR